MTPSRVLGYLSLIVGLAGLGAAGLRFAAATAFHPDTPGPATTVVAVGPEQEIGPDAVAARRAFLPIFGAVSQPVEAAVGTAPDQKPLRIDHDLKGVIATDRMRWAVFAGAQGDLLVREGDLIDDTARVARIHAGGVDVSVGDDIVSMTFGDGAPVEATSIAAVRIPSATDRRPDVLPRPEPQEMIYKSMSRAEVLAVLQDAEAQRQARGWVTVTQ